ncbi:MAG: hypothetical protein HY821_10805 [Acidobacteria bacterium]|nr:hypothetical protein [Acidobacteriota bacterium]
MNKLLMVAVIAGGFLVLYGVGRMWNLKPETKYNRTLHKGDEAVLVGAEGSKVWLAKKWEDSYHAQMAMGEKNEEWLKGAAVAAPAGARVKVVAEKESSREVEVEAGVKGWVEQEYLRAPHQGEMK